MKRQTVLTLFFVLFSLIGQAEIKVEVSETVELMSILSRTAGYEEYCTDVAGQYTKDTEAWFAPYKQHPIIAFYQDIRAKYGIAYERVMNMAIHLEIEKGKVKLIGDRSELNNGWQNVDLDDFIDQLNKFYKDTRFHEFFEQHLPFYEEYLKTYEANVMPAFHPEWYTRFHYGTEPIEQFHVVIGFTYGVNSNGISRQLQGKPREIFTIYGYWFDSAMGRPRYDAFILFHEMNHPFVNPLLDNPTNVALMEKVGQTLYQFAQPTMEQLHYNNWRIVINESLVRAAFILYIHENGYSQKQVLNQMGIESKYNDFYWMPELVVALRKYEANRDKYKTLNDYYPEIARFLGKYIEDEVARMQNALK